MSRLFHPIDGVGLPVVGSLWRHRRHGRVAMVLVIQGTHGLTPARLEYQYTSPVRHLRVGVCHRMRLHTKRQWSSVRRFHERFEPC